MAKAKETLDKTMPWLLALSCVLGILSAIMSIRNSIRQEKAYYEQKKATTS